MKLSRINTLLLCTIILVNGYIFVMPLIPVVSFWIQSHSGHAEQKLTSLLHPTLSTSGNHPDLIPQDNRLIIPAMLYNGPISEGPDARALSHGPWRIPNTSTPDKKHNTVIAGHRFTYTNPRGDFYHLDALKTGDEIGIFWQGHKYVYVVSTVKVVKADQIDIQNPTENPQLTLYTCTPLWLPKNRLVVIAPLKET